MGSTICEAPGLAYDLQDVWLASNRDLKDVALSVLFRIAELSDVLYSSLALREGVKLGTLARRLKTIQLNERQLGIVISALMGLAWHSLFFHLDPSKSEGAEVRQPRL